MKGSQWWRGHLLSGFQWFFFIFCNTVVIPPTLHPGIIISALPAGLINISNTFGAIRGTDHFYGDQPASNALYRRSFVSSIGFITQTQDSCRRPFIIGNLLFLLMGATASLVRFFCGIPRAISSAVMLVSCLPLLYSAFFFFSQVTMRPQNISCLALPLFWGIFFMNIPAAFLHSVLVMIRPLMSNGLLIGGMVSVLLENLLSWGRAK